MIKSPCKDCEERKVPKTCETTCAKWAYFKKKSEEQKEIIKKKKEIHYKLWRTYDNY